MRLSARLCLLSRGAPAALPLVLALTVGCGQGKNAPGAPVPPSLPPFGSGGAGGGEGGAPPPEGGSTGHDGAVRDAGTPSDAGRPPEADGGFVPGGRDPVSHGALTPITVRAAAGLSGVVVHDVAVDTGGNLWASTDGYVVFMPRGGAARRYTAADGLAEGDRSVHFQGVGAGLPRQGFVGTYGKWADVVDVRSDGSLAVHHLTITDPIHAIDITIAWRFAVDLGSAYGGTVWIGSQHGHSAVHGIAAGYCWGREGCFEEHRHSDPGGGPAGDVWGLAVCPNHDLWTGDAWWVGRMPWGAQGTMPDFWAVSPRGYPNPLVDAFPGVDDNISAIVCDEMGRLWIGSYGNGILLFDPMTFGARYFEAADALPQNVVTALLLDADGSLWVGTGWGGIGRYHPSTGRWSYYGMTAGLPSDSITAFAADFGSSPRTVYIAHSTGLSAYTGP